MDAARAASHEHPARVLGRDPRRRPRRRRRSTPQVGTGAGWTGETALIRLQGEVVKHPESVVLPLLLPDSPVVVWWPTDAAGRPGRRPARRAGPAPDHRRGASDPRQAAGDARPSARPTPRATPTWPGPGSPRGGRCSPRRSTSTRSRSRRRRSPAERVSPSADLLAAWLGDRLKVTVDRAQLRRARASPRSCWRPRRARSRISPPRRQAGHASARPASPTGRSR